MQDCSAKLYYLDPISMNDLEGGTLALVLYFQKTDRLFLLSFLYFDGICLPRKTILMGEKDKCVPDMKESD